jgi:hypothetical protein
MKDKELKIEEDPKPQSHTPGDQGTDVSKGEGRGEYTHVTLMQKHTVYILLVVKKEA